MDRLNINNKIIQNFFSSSEYAVIGASSDRSKYGNKVLRAYIQHHKKVYPVHPSEKNIEKLSVYHHVGKLPSSAQSISIITPPNVTEHIVKEAITHGIKHIWMQPGAESQQSIDLCEQHGIELIAGGPCILVFFGFKE